MRRPYYDSDDLAVERNHLATARSLLPFLWPHGRFDLRVRVAVAMVLLASAKIANVYVPFMYKAAVDALDVATAVVIALPVAAILAYGIARVLAQAFGELRDAVFAKVSQHAIRSVALATFIAPPQVVAALPSRASNRGAVAGHRARHQGHSVPAQLHAVQHPADLVRDFAGLRHPARALQRLVRDHHLRLSSLAISALPSPSPSGAPSSAAR